jgi:hypothetical protein
MSCADTIQRPLDPVTSVRILEPDPFGFSRSRQKGGLVFVVVGKSPQRANLQ